MNTPVLRYTLPAMLLHWLMAVLILGALAVGFYMTGLKLSPAKLQLYSWHKWTGVSIFLLALLRLVWRWRHAPPSLPPMAEWQRRASGVSHVLLYLAMLAMPLSGWLMSSAKGFQTVYFGVLPLPDLVDKNLELAEVLKEVHETIAWLLIGLIGLHVLAALKHHFIDRDTVLARMVPGLRPRQE